MDFLLLGVLALMIVFLMMQNRRRRKEVELMQNAIEVGAQVTLHAGIKGTVAAIHGDDIEVESGKSKFVVVRGAVAKVTAAAGEK